MEGFCFFMSQEIVWDDFDISIIWILLTTAELLIMIIIIQAVQMIISNNDTIECAVCPWAFKGNKIAVFFIEVVQIQFDVLINLIVIAFTFPFSVMTQG